MLIKSDNHYGKNHRQDSLVKPNTIPNLNGDLTAQASLQERHLQELAQTVVELKLTSMAETEDQNQLLRYLHSKVRWLTIGWLGSMIMVFALGTWLTYRLHGQQQKLAMQTLYLQETSKSKSEQLKVLDRKLQELSSQVPSNLAQNLRMYHEQVNTLKKQVDKLSQGSKNRDVSTFSLEQRQDAITILSQALEEINRQQQIESITENASEANQEF